MDFTVPPQKDSIRQWLEKELIPIHTDRVIPYKGTKWTHTHGFRRAFHIHAVYTDGTSYAFDVQPDTSNGWHGDTAPNMGEYPSMDALLDGVAEMYEMWWTGQK